MFQKHEVEKRRRARMNEQIGQLRLIVQPTIHEEVTQISFVCQIMHFIIPRSKGK